jgi:hypothetical protein
MSKRTCEVLVRDGVIAEHGSCLLCTTHRAGSKSEMRIWMARTISAAIARDGDLSESSVSAIRVERTTIEISNGGRMDAGSFCRGNSCESCSTSVYPDTEATRSLLLRLRKLHGDFEYYKRSTHD